LSYFVIPLVAAFVSLLTFFSGFGLGMLLTPVFAIFFPIELSVSLTAIVHLLNNAFKFFLIGRNARLSVVLRFGIPAVLAAMVGSWLLGKASELPVFYSYMIGSKTFYVFPVKVLMALLIASFVLFEIVPRLKNLEIDPRYLGVGGVLSGFFGGLSGHQGALRSAFLARSGLTKEQFIATNAAIAVCIDVARLIIYSQHLSGLVMRDIVPLLTLTCLFAFTGAFAGSMLLKKITMNVVQKIVTVSLFILAVCLGAGWI
jgi:uncharacterized membrane protein YfcA